MDTNYQMLLQLNKEYDALEHTRGIVSMKEIYLINEKLHLDEMSILDLRNLRDFIVLFFTMKDDVDMEVMDKMSAYVSVIDNKIFNLGGEV